MPPTFPVGSDLKVAHGISLETVSLASEVDLSKPTVVHLVTDYDAITEANLQHLSTKADEFPDANFVAILWFLGCSNSKQFFCPADRKGVDCTEDDPKGMLLKEVVAYLPSGSKVKVVQDIQKPYAGGGSSSSGSCTDGVGTANCKSMQGAGFTCNDDKMKTNCRLTCGICTEPDTCMLLEPAERPMCQQIKKNLAEGKEPCEDADKRCWDLFEKGTNMMVPSSASTTTTQAPTFVPPTCDYYCGAVWNQFGSTGSVESKWNMKEMIITYAAGGSYVATVNPPSSSSGVPGPKLWDGDLKTKVDDAIAAVASTGGAPSPPPSPAMPPTFPVGSDLKVAHGISLETVSLASVVDLSKPTVVHLVTDYDAITEANLQHLSTKADEFPDANFVAILWFLGGSNSKQFFCPADRKGVDCTEDDPKGMLLKEVVAYLPSGSKVKVVQDIQKPYAGGGSSSSDSCTDGLGTANCKSMQDAGFCNDDTMNTNCRL